MFVNANHLDNIVREINAQIRYGILAKLNALVLYANSKVHWIHVIWKDIQNIQSILTRYM